MFTKSLIKLQDSNKSQRGALWGEIGGVMYATHNLGRAFIITTLAIMHIYGLTTFDDVHRDENKFDTLAFD